MGLPQESCIDVDVWDRSEMEPRIRHVLERTVKLRNTGPYLPKSDSQVAEMLNCFFAAKGLERDQRCRAHVGRRIEGAIRLHIDPQMQCARGKAGFAHGPVGGNRPNLSRSGG